MQACFCRTDTDVVDRVPLKEVITIARKHIDVAGLQSYRRPTHPDPERRGTLFQLLAQIIISQRATLDNEIRAAESLFKEYPHPADIRTASVENIAEKIRPAGLQRSKAMSPRAVTEAWGEAPDDVESVVTIMDDVRAREYLMQLPRVGKKTADCMLELGLGRTVLPIETNIRQLADVLGYRHTRLNDTELQIFLQSQLEQTNEACAEAHALLLGLGQRLCGSRNACEECPLCIERYI